MTRAKVRSNKDSMGCKKRTFLKYIFVSAIFQKYTTDLKIGKNSLQPPPETAVVTYRHLARRLLQ
jgi:hypothetical protein